MKTVKIEEPFIYTSIMIKIATKKMNKNTEVNFDYQDNLDLIEAAMLSESRPQCFNCSF